MKDHPGLEDMLDRGLAKGIWGTKQRSQIQSANPEGIKKLVAQQFEFGKRTIAKGMIPILEPEVDITAKDKAEIEELLLPELMKGLDTRKWFASLPCRVATIWPNPTKGLRRTLA